MAENEQAAAVEGGGEKLSGICMHEGRAKREFVVTNYTDAKNKKTLVAHGLCTKCGSNMAKIVKKPQS